MFVLFAPHLHDSATTFSNLEARTNSPARREALEKLKELTDGLKPGQNVLGLLARLNKEDPDSWRPNSVAPNETMTETLQAMKQAVREHRRLSDGSESETITETVVIKKGLQ